MIPAPHGLVTESGGTVLAFSDDGDPMVLDKAGDGLTESASPIQVEPLREIRELTSVMPAAEGWRAVFLYPSHSRGHQHVVEPLIGWGVYSHRFGREITVSGLVPGIGHDRIVPCQFTGRGGGFWRYLQPGEPEPGTGQIEAECEYLVHIGARHSFQQGIIARLTGTERLDAPAIGDLPQDQSQPVYDAMDKWDAEHPGTGIGRKFPRPGLPS